MHENEECLCNPELLWAMNLCWTYHSVQTGLAGWCTTGAAWSPLRSDCKVVVVLTLLGTNTTAGHTSTQNITLHCQCSQHEERIQAKLWLRWTGGDTIGGSQDQQWWLPQGWELYWRSQGENFKLKAMGREELKLYQTQNRQLFCLSSTTYLFAMMTTMVFYWLQVSVLDCIRRLDVGGLSSLLADVAPLSDEEEAGPDYPLPSQHWLNTPLGREGEFKTFLQLALETNNNDIGGFEIQFVLN